MSASAQRAPVKEFSMKMKASVCAVLVASSVLVALPGAVTATAAPATQKAPAKAGRLVTISGSESMKYDTATITARPGETLHIVLKAVGVMPRIAMAHDFVLLKLGTDAMAFANATAADKPGSPLPPALKAKTIVATTFAAAGETVEATFKAPAAAGSYTYLCTFPGHFQSGMKGTLVVK
jgi:azurin